MTERPSSNEQRSYEEAISLVDIVVLILRHWKTMAVIVVVGLLLTIVTALLIPQKYVFNSLYSVAEYVNLDGETKSLETTESLMARIENVYLEAESQRLQEANALEEMPIEVQGQIPNNSRLILLRTEANEEYMALITELHEQVLARLDQHQNERVQQRRESLQTELEATIAQFDSVSKSSATHANVLITNYQERITELETMLNQLRDGSIEQIAMQKVKTSGATPFLIIILGLLLTLLLAPFGAVLVHFSSLVSDRLKKTQ